MSYSALEERNLYGNCYVYSPDNILMFRCSERKAKWYINKQLGEVIEEKPLKIRLNFEPNGLGNSEALYGLQDMSNHCVCCGTTTDLTRHHVVPYEYRKNFPEELKSRSSHDVVLLCIPCHTRYEKVALLLRRTIAGKYNAPLHRKPKLSKLHKLKTKIHLLLHMEYLKNVPDDVIAEYQRQVSRHTGGDISDNAISELLANIKKEEIESSITHGEIVVNKLKTIEDILEFEKMWRRHFIENTDCKYLPPNWSIDYVRKYNKGKD